MRWNKHHCYCKRSLCWLLSVRCLPRRGRAGSVIYCDISPRGRGLTQGSAGALVLASLSPAVKDFPQEAATSPEVSQPLDHKNLSGCIIWGGRVRSRCYVTHPRTLRRGHLRGELSPTIRHSSAAPAFLYDKNNSTGPEQGKEKQRGSDEPRRRGLYNTSGRNSSECFATFLLPLWGPVTAGSPLQEAWIRAAVAALPLRGHLPTASNFQGRRVTNKKDLLLSLNIMISAPCFLTNPCIQNRKFHSKQRTRWIVTHFVA